MYHRIAAADVDPWGLCVRPQHLEHQLELLTERSMVVGLEDLVAGPGPAQPTVALTLDDGYLDTATEAAPRLRTFAAPATVYVTTGGFDHDVVGWWDVLADVVLRPGVLPASLPVELAAIGMTEVPEPARRYGAREAARTAGWAASDPPPTARHELYLAMWRAIIASTPVRQARAVAALAELGNSPATTGGRLLHRDEVAALHEEPFITIGAHTERHLSLPTLDSAMVRRELLDSTRTLERAIDNEVRHFAYPYGRYNVEAREAVLAAGFTTAVTTDMRLLNAREDPLLLPRVAVPDLGPDRFSAWLEDVLGIPAD